MGNKAVDTHLTAAHGEHVLVALAGAEARELAIERARPEQQRAARRPLVIVLLGVALLGAAYYSYCGGKYCKRSGRIHAAAKTRGSPTATAAIMREGSGSVDIASQRESTAIADDLAALDKACTSELDWSDLESSKMMRELEGLQLARCHSLGQDEPTSTTRRTSGRDARVVVASFV